MDSDKDGTIALQNLDCNCNNCELMLRDDIEFKLWKGWHEHLQYMDFMKKRRHNFRIAAELIWGSPQRTEITEDTIRQGKHLERIGRKMKFQFDKEGLLQYGICLSRNGKWNQPVTFSPNTCQLDTQHCFSNRRK